MPEQYTTLDMLRGEVLAHVTKALEREPDNNINNLSYPPNASLGALAYGCFSLAKEERKKPDELASELAKKINSNIAKDDTIERAENAGPYINFHAKNLAKKVLEEIDEKDTAYGKREEVKKTLLFEFSQPNTHKSFHVGHLRGTILGQAMTNLLRANGYTVIPINYSGDVGAHIEKILWWMENNPDIQSPEGKKTDFLGKLYAEAERELKKNPGLKKEVESIRERLVKKDKKLLKLWKETRKWSIDELSMIYNELGVTFDAWYYESEFEKKGTKLVKKLLKKGIAIESNGAVIIDLQKFNLDVFLILRSDGSPLYATKELALAEQKAKDFDFDEAIIQTDVRQSLYFKQFFKTLELMGETHPMRNETYDFVDLPSGAMSSRRGNVVTYKMLRDELIATIKAETKKRHKEWSKQKIEDVARTLAYATLKFEMLKIDTHRKITFDSKRALSFDGFTASYILYTIARINSIAKKVEKKIKNPHYHVLNSPIETTLIHMLMRFPEMIKESVDSYNPAMLVNYLFTITKNFSTFYHQNPILNAPNEEIRTARFALATHTKIVITNGLTLLGIKTVEEM